MLAVVGCACLFVQMCMLHFSAKHHMTTIPRMIVLPRGDSPENDPQDDLTPTPGQISARYAERSEPANRIDPLWAFGSDFAGQLPNLQVLVWEWQTVIDHFWTSLRALSSSPTKSGHSLITWSIWDSSANRRWACSNLAGLSLRESGTNRSVGPASPILEIEDKYVRTHSTKTSWLSVRLMWWQLYWTGLGELSRMVCLTPKSCLLK